MDALQGRPISMAGDEHHLCSACLAEASGGFDAFFSYAEKMSPLGNASSDDCAAFTTMLFSDMARMVTMQNLFHDGGFSFTGVSTRIVEEIQKAAQQ